MESGNLAATAVIREKQVDGVVILSVQRSLKGEVEAALKERIEALVRAGQMEILIDLRAMPFVDSSELGRLIRAHIAVRQAGGRVRLCNLSGRVAALMKMTRLDTVLEIYNTDEEALDSLRKHRLEQG
jgi:anti-anti-sigma factor